MITEYEAVFIFDAPDASGAETVLGNVKQLLAQLDITFVGEESLGRRPFAYPIQKHDGGVYHVLHFKAEPAALPKLNKELKFIQNILRYLVVKKEEPPKGKIKPKKPGAGPRHAPSHDRPHSSSHSSHAGGAGPRHAH